MEIKDVNEWLGIESEDLEDFKTKFKEKYFTEEEVLADKAKLGKFTSKTLSGVEANAFKIAKGYGVEVNKDEFKGKKTEEIINALFEAKEGQHQTFVEKMKADSKQGADEKFTKLNEEYEKALSKVSDLETLNQSTASKFDEAEKEWGNKIKTFKKDYFEKDLYSTFNYAPDLDPLKKKGWQSEMREKYRFDFDETDTAYVTDSEGKRIENPAKHGTFKSPLEVLKEEGEKAGVISVNPQAGKPAPKPHVAQGTQQVTQLGSPPEVSRRRVNPRAMQQ